MRPQSMIASRPQLKGQTNDALTRCIELCFDCAQTCLACAGACLDEKELEGLRECIRLDLDCADICAVVGAIGARRGADGSSMRAVLRACAETCRLCTTGELNDMIAGERLLGRLVQDSNTPAVGYAADLVRATLAASPKLAHKAVKTRAVLYAARNPSDAAQKGIESLS